MDKRTGKRRIKRLAVTFSCGTVQYSGTSSDFSPKGLFIRTRKALPPGSVLDMVLEVEKDRKIALKGIVARSIKTGVMDFKNGMGVQLITLSSEYDDFLKSFLDS